MNKYNINNPDASLAKLLNEVPEQRDVLDDLMNGPIREKLAIIPESIIWGGEKLFHFSTKRIKLSSFEFYIYIIYQDLKLKWTRKFMLSAQSGTVFSKQSGHFMRPVVDVCKCTSYAIICLQYFFGVCK